MRQRPEPAFIVARGVTRRYRLGDVTIDALRGVDFSVARGEMVALMGPSGCGKTTLLNCLAGLDAPDEGEIWIDGALLSALGDRERTAYRARHMGFIFQAFNLLPVLSAVENVELPLLVGGVGAREARRRALAALAEVGLADRAKHAPAQLSGGQQQRVAVARALVTRPAIVWADEPTGNLDSAAADDVMARIGELHRTAGQTIVLVTHSREIAERADRIVHLRDGRIEEEESLRRGSSAVA
ncbi:MAG TPA: ABC transporter ATP-binding protein [Dehalococcoidia bacterium]|nr:ABC transporter ATP-binding protein [Dehalococcoidia bacterium]